MNRLLSLAKGSKAIFDNQKTDYQIHDSITFEEVDDASNFQLQVIPEKVLYETNRFKKEQKSQRIFLARTKDYSANNSIRINAFDVKELYSSKTRTTGYYHLAAVQILVKWLGNAGTDIPIKISIRDCRILDKEKSILGLWSSNLYTGAIYTILALDYLVAANDKNLSECLVLDISAGIDLLPGSNSLSVSVCTYSSWIPTPHPFRNREGEFGLNELKEGKSIYLKPRDMDIMNVPQPIPIDELSYDLNFEFNERVNHKPSVSTHVKYKVETSKGLNIRLEQPSHLRKTKSSRFPSLRLSEINDD